VWEERVSEACPGCNVDLDGGTIPENIREHYSPPYRWSRKIGLSDGDSIHTWKCPDCEATWPRSSRLPSGHRQTASSLVSSNNSGSAE
jgi:hypothetical protein